MRYFVRLSYNGAGFHGWQTQPNALSVQQKIEESLSIVLRTPITIVGAGRTDAGVHAKEMFAHFDLPFQINDKSKLLISLNRLVGKNIAFYEIFEVSAEAHARFDATERTYKYFVCYEKNPFLYPFAWHSPSLLNIRKMNEAAKLLLSVDDFTSFAKLHSDVKTNICHVSQAIWTEHVDEMPLMGRGIVFTITANRFLRNMVRAIVGTLVDVGREKISLIEFDQIIKSKNRCSAGISMPAEGLFLWKIKYPYTSC
ncbi:MAG: tRNA pseudouridine(38-40) synthase TruA [Muribaculaceae bacterium]|nr:tRNA pseudouridine(38-40) synthase TruA [Muribaculaceae bacterium]